jgi:NRPS condensation-like uncharacterized protein
MATADPMEAADELVSLMRTLEHSGRLHRDRPLGRMFHPGKVSFRETRPGNSLHISVDDNRVLAHVDLVSPLKLETERASRYSLLRVASHNVTGMAGDVVRLLRGRQGDHTCELDFEFSWAAGGPEAGGEQEANDGSRRRPASAKDGTGERKPPSNVLLEIRVAGPLDEVRLSHAFAQALGRYWEPTPDALAFVDCPDDAALAATRAELQALAVPFGVPALGVRLARTPNGDVVMTNCNAAVMDGFGAMQLLRWVARAYAGQAPPPPPLDLLALHRVPVCPTSGTTRGVWLYRAALEKVRNRLAPPALVAPDHGGETTGVDYHLVTLSEDDTATLVHFDHPGTSTDVLLTALHLAIASWNAQHGSSDGRISVLVSANLRSPELPEAAVGNFSVTARVSTSRRHRRHPGQALRVVSSQTSLNRRRRTGVALLEALHRLGLLTLWARQSVIVLQPVSGNRYVDTAMLCNLGRLRNPPDFGADGGTPVDVWFSPPTRIPIGLTVGTATVRGRLHLVLRYPRRLFDEGAAARFARCYVEQLRRMPAASRRRAPFNRPPASGGAA